MEMDLELENYSKLESIPEINKFKLSPSQEEELMDMIREYVY